MATEPCPEQSRPDLGLLARPSGALAMVAIDQRESLRAIFARLRGAQVPDETIVDFKLAVTERLAPYASAMLFDRHFAVRAFEAAAVVNPGCGRILAADALVQEPGQPVEDTDIDPKVDPALARAQGAVALKLLLIWRGDVNARRCVELAERFVERCREAGLLAIVEGIVRAPRTGGGAWNREAAIVDAARAIGTAQPDLYKCEVPFQGIGEEAAISDVCAQINAALPCPWVILSQGVTIADYPRAVEIACRGGASGFLAGRAVWGDTLAHDDYRDQIEAISVPRLRHLVEIVDVFARPCSARSDEPAGRREGRTPVVATPD